MIDQAKTWLDETFNDPRGFKRDLREHREKLEKSMQEHRRQMAASKRATDEMLAEMKSGRIKRAETLKIDEAKRRAPENLKKAQREKKLRSQPIGLTILGWSLSILVTFWVLICFWMAAELQGWLRANDYFEMIGVSIYLAVSAGALYGAASVRALQYQEIGNRSGASYRDSVWAKQAALNANNFLMACVITPCAHMVVEMIGGIPNIYHVGTPIHSVT